MVQTFDVIVAGMGAMGSAAMYQLAKRGVKVLGLDLYNPPHRKGSSHGETRMTRAACGEGQIFTEFAQRSHAIWRDIESETGAQLLTLNGQLLLDKPGASEGHGVPDFLGQTAALAARSGIAHEVLGSEEIRKRFPAFAVGDDERAYFDTSSGYVRPEACIEAQLSLAEKFGAAVRGSEPVTKIASSGTGVRVSTPRGEYAAKTLILSAGAWLPGLLPPKEKGRFSVRRQVLYWFAVRDERDLPMFRPENFPAFVWFKKKPAYLVYGFPALGTAREGIKLASEQTEIETTPEQVERSVGEEEKRAFYEMYVRPSFPALSEDCVRAEVCLYTVETAHQRFIIDRHPDMENVFCVSACWGHGFKHSAAIGELLADMAGDGTQGVPQFAWEFEGTL